MQAFSSHIAYLLALHKSIRWRKYLQIPCKFEGCTLFKTAKVSKMGMKGLLFSLLLSALGLTGCFHLQTQSRPVNKYVEDPVVTACRERGMSLLKQYAPDSYWLMQNYYTVQQKQVERGLIIMSADIHDPFSDFFSTYTKEIDIMKNLAALVHESDHGLIRYLGTELALTHGKNTLYPKKYYGILLNETERFLVEVTPFFPTRAIDASAPPELQATSRYQLYVLSPSPDQGTQQDGIYGLLDEWEAYYWTLRTDVSLLSYYERQKEVSMEDVVYVVSRVDDWYHAYLEFKCFMLQYLLYARAHAPEAYQGIMVEPGIPPRLHGPGQGLRRAPTPLFGNDGRFHFISYPGGISGRKTGASGFSGQQSGEKNVAAKAAGRILEA